MQGTISKRSVDALRAGEILWDKSVIGFGVRRQQDAAVYIVKYRVGKGKQRQQRWVTIGRHGKYTPETARRKAKQLLGFVADDRDPAQEKGEAARKAADTLTLVAEAYLAVA